MAYSRQEFTNKEIVKMTEKVREHISNKRFHHSLGVSYTASALAMRYGYDVTTARVAGILHDCAKALDDDETIKECNKYGLDISEEEMVAPSNLLHARVGEVYAKEKYEIFDEEILSAIRWHTTGRAEMTLLDKILFVADYIEPNRKPIESIEKVRKIAFEDLDKAVYMELYSTINYLSGKDSDKAKSVERHTLEAYEYYKNICEVKE